MNSDQTSATSVFYTPYVGNQCPIWNGNVTSMYAFAQQTLALASQHVASNIYDVFAFLNPSGGAFTIATGPAWATSTAGSGARGTGAATTQLVLLSQTYASNQH
jgi:hypothetical protein